MNTKQWGMLTGTSALPSGGDSIFTKDAMSFVEILTEKFSPERQKLLEQRKLRQEAFDHGKLPNFLSETAAIRQDDWQIGSIPKDLQERTVEITGPVDRKMIINALNAPVKVFMADFEDSLSPTWNNIVEGQINLRDAVNKTISFENSEGKTYQLKPNTAVLIARVRGLHLDEKHILFNNTPIPGCLLDFGLYFYHNAKNLLNQGTGPYFYLPKLEHHLEAKWWNDVFSFAEKQLGFPVGTIKSTVLIETLPAAFQMDEILFELKEHIVGLNCGRWDYIFSFIKTLRKHRNFVLPDRNTIGMDKHFLNSYSKLLIKTCHKRGAFAMGGMSAFIPVKDEAKNKAAMQKVKEDKLREVKNGHDGTWIAHPGLAATAIECFESHMHGPNQLHKQLSENITAADLLEVPSGDATREGLLNNIKVAVQYLEAWISGNGCVPLYSLMEDAATAEICRTQIWQWIFHKKHLKSGEVINQDLFRTTLNEAMNLIEKELGAERFASGQFKQASALMDEITTSDECVEFLTLPAYRYLS